MKAKIAIGLTNNLSPTHREVVTKAANVLRASEVDVIIREMQESDDSNITIEVLEAGTISEVEIKNFLSCLFADKSLSGISVELKDEERSFELPDEDGECIDWFIKE